MSDKNNNENCTPSAEGVLENDTDMEITGMLPGEWTDMEEHLPRPENTPEWRRAFREAGHVVMGSLVGYRIEVEGALTADGPPRVRPGGPVARATANAHMLDYGGVVKRWLANSLALFRMAGKIAEARAFPAKSAGTQSAVVDPSIAGLVQRQDQEEARKALERLEEAACYLVANHWEIIEATAHALVRGEGLTAGEVDDLMLMTVPEDEVGWVAFPLLGEAEIMEGEDESQLVDSREALAV